MSPHFLHHSCGIFPKNNIYTVFHREISTFLLILTLLPPNKTRYVWLIYQKFSSVHLTHLSCDICLKIRYGHVFTNFDPVFSHFPPKQSKFAWYIENCHLRILYSSHVAFTPQMTFILWSLGRWKRFCHLCLQNKVNFDDISTYVTLITPQPLLINIP